MVRKSRLSTAPTASVGHLHSQSVSHRQTDRHSVSQSVSEPNQLLGKLLLLLLHNYNTQVRCERIFQSYQLSERRANFSPLQCVFTEKLAVSMTMRKSSVTSSRSQVSRIFELPNFLTLKHSIRATRQLQQ